MKDPILKIRNIAKSFNTKQILSGLDLDIFPGEIIGIIGSSGSGKTTLLNTMVGFINPDSGSVDFRVPEGLTEGNTTVYKSVYKNQKAIKNLYGFASQLPSFYEKLNVRENLEYFGKMYDLNKETLDSNIATLLKLMNLEASELQQSKNLSGGMERRLDIACSLIHNPQILILDEPTADLDPVLRNNIWGLVEKINKKGTTIVLSSHHLNELETLCDRIAILKEGKVLAVGSAEELRKKFRVKEQIVVQAKPGKFEGHKTYMKKFSKQISSFEHKDDELIVTCEKPQDIMEDLLKQVEKHKEKIISLNLVKPDLDRIFISISQEEKE